MFDPADRNLEHIRKMMPEEAFAVWCASAKEAYDYVDYNEAVKAAWDALAANGWKRVGKRFQKDNPTSSDVHVDAPMGGAAPPSQLKPSRPKKRKPEHEVDVWASDDDESDEGDQIKQPTKKHEEGEPFTLQGDISKVDDSLGLVFGWAMICKRDGEAYWDLQGDHIPEDAMLNAAADFMQSSRISGEMHARDDNGNAVQDGAVVFTWPMTKDIAEAMGMPDPQTTGLMIGIKPSPGVLAKFKDGTYTGFSIGGYRVTDEAVE